MAVTADIGDRASLEAVIPAVTAQLGRPTTLVNNAGIADGEAALDLADADWDRVLETNLTGAWQMAQLCAQDWVAAKRPGNIINISSILGLRVAAHSLPYAVSKAGLIQMTKALSLEWARYQIRVNAIAPGEIDTSILSPGTDKIVAQIPMRRLGTPDEVAKTIYFL